MNQISPVGRHGETDIDPNRKCHTTGGKGGPDAALHPTHHIKIALYFSILESVGDPKGANGGIEIDPKAQCIIA
jgi:hypothetical protein